MKTKRICVGNLSSQTTAEELSAIFSKYGVVEFVNIATENETGISGGFALVLMASDDADRAISQLNGVELKGSPLRIEELADKCHSQEELIADRVPVPTVRTQRSKRQDVGSRQSRSPAAQKTSSDLQQTGYAHVTTKEAYTVDLDGIVAVTARAIEVLGTREKAIRWLRTPLPSLSDRTPLSMLNTTDGIEHVEDVLGRIEQGVW